MLVAAIVASVYYVVIFSKHLHDILGVKNYTAIDADNIFIPRRFHKISNHSIPKPTWAFITLITKAHALDGTFGYFHQALALGLQLQSLYPAVPRIALLCSGQVQETHARLLQQHAGFIITWRPAIPPPPYYDGPGVYADQFMKFYAWDMTQYDRLVFFDSDTFLLRRIDFQRLVDQQLDPEHIPTACPTSSSRIDPETQAPTTWNGAFFIIRPSRAVFDRLMAFPAKPRPSHFATLYPHVGFLDATEMGVFLRDLPGFQTPENVSDICSDFLACCVQPSCVPAFAPLGKTTDVAMVHFLKPVGPIPDTVDGYTRLFVPQAEHPYADWGFNATCIVEEFGARIAQHYFRHADALSGSIPATRTQRL